MVQTGSTRRREARGSEEKRTEILRKAAAVFRRKGFHGAGMREIAKALSMAPGALYYYFASKEELLYACQMLSLKRLLGSARTIVAGSEPAPRKLRNLVHAHLGHILDALGGSFAHVEFHALPAVQLTQVVSKRDAYEGLVRGVIAAGIERGEFRPTDVKLAALALLGALNWTVVWWRPEGGYDIEEVGDRIAETFLTGISK
ncbi:MAG: TetR/AcrR family transcriptional regulator [Planctomycetes bacterium]|nr:TetR/AcrR family transcriptional regulator [Planctomycetota bacterium]